MKEIILYQDLIDAAEEWDWSLFRMLDLAGKMPFDLIGWSSAGRAVGVEVKMERRIGGLRIDAPMPASWFDGGRRHQLGFLRKLANDGGVALIMVYRADRKGGGWTMLRLRSGLVGDLRMVPVSCFEVTELGSGLEGWICSIITP